MDCPLCCGVGEQHPDHGPCAFCDGTGKCFKERSVPNSVVDALNTAFYK